MSERDIETTMAPASMTGGRPWAFPRGWAAVLRLNAMAWAAVALAGWSVAGLAGAMVVREHQVTNHLVRGHLAHSRPLSARTFPIRRTISSLSLTFRKFFIARKFYTKTTNLAAKAAKRSSSRRKTWDSLADFLPLLSSR